MRSQLVRGICAAGIMAATLSGLSRPAAAESAVAVGAVTVTAIAEIDGKRYDYSGPGECYYHTGGTIFEQPATMWHAMFKGRNPSMSYASLAIWRLTQDGSTRLNLSVLLGNSAYAISTSQPSAPKGTAVGSARNGATGGQLQAEGRTADGHAVKVSIVCSRFEAPEDNGD